MREIIPDQLPLVPVPVKHPIGSELGAVSQVLDAHPEACEWVHADLVRGLRRPELGREGLSGEQVLRTSMWQRYFDLTYEELSFDLADSASAQTFCRIALGEETSASALQRGHAKVRPETWEAINRLLVQTAHEEGIEPGRRARIDSTAVETNIHHPTDSSLLVDCIRVVTRLLGRAQDFVRVSFTDHTERARRRGLGISNARGEEKKLPLYRDLLKVTERTVRAGMRAAEALDGLKTRSAPEAQEVAELASELRTYLGRTKQVVDQTRRRVLEGETVPATQKIVSIFEPHSDIIRKDNRNTVYGHKVFLSVGEELITDCLLPSGNPADATLATEMVRRQEEVFGSLPRDVALDGGFASSNNLAAIKGLDVKNVAFAKRRGLEVADMVDSPRRYRSLRNFRAGIEKFIGFLKHTLGLARCIWRGLQGFKRYAWSAIVAANVIAIARHRLAT